MLRAAGNPDPRLRRPQRVARPPAARTCPPGRSAWDGARDAVVLAAKAAGLQAIDGPYLGIAVDEHFRAAALRARELGFDGKWAIHPAQVAALDEIFTPSDARRRPGPGDRRRARRAGDGAVALDGAMLDEALRQWAIGVLASAELGHAAGGRPRREGGRDGPRRAAGAADAAQGALPDRAGRRADHAGGDRDVDAGISCSVQTGRAIAQAGLHPATGGDGTLLCSGDMLLEALAACAGVTLRAVATALGITIDAGRVVAEGDLDFRGTLAVDRDAPSASRRSASASTSTRRPDPTTWRRCSS